MQRLKLGSIAWSTESTHDERKRGSTTDLQKISKEPPIVVFVVSRALFRDLFFEFFEFIFLVLFDLFGIDGGFLVLMETRVSSFQRGRVDDQDQITYLLILSTITRASALCTSTLDKPRTHIKS